MFHGTLTLLARSLRMDALQLRAHAFRTMAVGIVFLLLIVTHIYTAGRGSPGLKFFSLICQLCLGLITVAGAGHFATAITEEKEAGTLHLLLLANVPTLAILLGKSTTRIVSVLLLFIGIFPFAFLALALGGATAHQVWSGLLALIAYLVLVANIGLAASVIRRTGPSASVMTTAILLALLSAPYLLARFSKALVAVGWTAAGSPLIGRIDHIQRILDDHSIITRIQRIQMTGFSESAWSGQVLWSVALGAALFGLSWALFRRFTEYLGETSRGRTGLLKVSSSPRRSVWRSLLTPRPWQNAILWKDFHFLVGGLLGLLSRFVVIPIVAIGLFAVDQLLSAGMNLKAHDAMRLALLIAAALEVVALSARTFNWEYRNHTLCTLALLPRSTIALCSSKVAGCSLVLIPYVLWFLIVGGRYQTDLDELARVYLLDPAAIVMLCLVLVLAHLTAWLSLHVKWGALPLSIMILMVLTSCISPFVAIVAAATGARSGRLNYEGAYPAVYLTLLTCTALQVAIGLRFRRAAAD